MVEYTEAELQEFNKATWDNVSYNQVTRVAGRLALSRLLKTHGKEKCDAMWAECLKREKA